MVRRTCLQSGKVYLAGQLLLIISLLSFFLLSFPSFIPSPSSPTLCLFSASSAACHDLILRQLPACLPFGLVPSCPPHRLIDTSLIGQKHQIDYEEKESKLEELAGQSVRYVAAVSAWSSLNEWGGRRTMGTASSSSSSCLSLTAEAKGERAIAVGFCALLHIIGLLLLCLHVRMPVSCPTISSPPYIACSRAL
jgi:hypothetical protein